MTAIKSNLPSFVTEEQLLEGIKNTTKNENLEIISTQIKQPDVVGAHFISAVDNITVKTVDSKTKKQKVYNLFAKYATPDESRQEMARHFNPTRKEVIFFLEILPLMRRFCEEELKDSSETLLEHYPVCYFAASNEYDPIILEDLIHEKYRLNTPNKDQDDRHALMALKYMAEFHAVSNHLLRKKSRRELLERFPFLDFAVFSPALKPIFGGIIRSNFNAALSLVNDPVKNTKFDLLEKNLDALYDCLLPINQPQDPFTVINMGDCWNNNMMFKYNSKGVPVDMKFIDFQISRLDCMTYDLAYFIFSTTDQTKWKTDLPRYLRHYYDSFTSTLLKFRGVDKPSFTFEEFEDLFRLRCPLGFGVMLSIFPIRMLSKHHDFSDPNVARKEGDGEDLMEEIGNAVIKATKTPGIKEIFKSRIIAAFDIVQYGFRMLLKKN